LFLGLPSSYLAFAVVAILKMLDSKSELLDCGQPDKLLMALAETVEQTMGGCSGAVRQSISQSIYSQSVGQSVNQPVSQDFSLAKVGLM